MTTHPDGSESVTIVTRDSPWTDEEREFALRVHDEVCPSCGNLRSVCSNPDVTWFPQRRICYSKAAQALTVRRVQARHERNQPGTELLHPTDGMSVWMSDLDLTPDDDFV